MSCGTDIEIERSGIPALIPVEQCYLGWHNSLTQLAALLKANVEGDGRQQSQVTTQFTDISIQQDGTGVKTEFRTLAQ